MSMWQAVLLGLIQGLTEFIPISSTAHLTIAGKLMGLISAEHPELCGRCVANLFGAGEPRSHA